MSDPSIPYDKLPLGMIFLGYRGSVAHGMHIPSSDPDSIDDIDLIGVYVAPPEHYLGLNRSKQTIEIKEGEFDIVVYEVQHFLHLLVKQNPNVLSTLWLDPWLLLNASDEWHKIKSIRNAFASKEAFKSFEGYAQSQLTKMTRIPEDTEEREKQIQEIKDEIRFRENRAGSDPPWDNLDYKTFSTQDLRQKVNGLKGQTGYMGKKRKELVERFGYDTKNAAHLLRLLIMCEEFMKTGHLQVNRRGKDANFLLGVKRGAFSLKRIEELGEYYKRKAKEAAEKSRLPEQPDRNMASVICQGILLKHINMRM